MFFQPDDSFISVGMSDGLVQFLHRKIPLTIEEREKERLRKNTSQKFRRFTHYESGHDDDIVVKEDQKAKESRHDYFLRKFEYSKALDQVLKPYVMKRHPEYTYSVLRELKRRNGLKTALGGRDERALLPLLQYLHRNIGDARFSAFLIEVVDITLDLYASTLGSCPSTDRVFVDIRKRVERETRTLRQLMLLQGSLDLVLSSSSSTKANAYPKLTREESKMGNILEKDQDADKDSYLYKVLLTN